MSINIEDCRYYLCPYCGEYTVNPFSDICENCGYDCSILRDGAGPSFEDDSDEGYFDEEEREFLF